MKSCNSTEITTEAGIHNLQKRRDLFVMCASPFVCSSFSAFSSRLPQLAWIRKIRKEGSNPRVCENWRVLSRAGWRECLLTEIGRAGQENVWLEIMTLCSVCSVRSVRTSWTRVNYYRFRPSHSVNNYIFWAESLEYSLRPSLRYASTRV